MSRFLSLFLLSALAVAFLAGLRTTAPDMERTADQYFDRLQLMDLRVLSTLGLTDEDISVLGSRTGVARAEGSYTADALLRLAEHEYVLKLHALSPSGINAPDLLEGRLPQHDRECLVEPRLLEESGLKLGDAITLDTGDGTFEDALKYDDYTIVGTANSPLYISIERGSSSLGAGRVSAFALLPVGAFDMDVYTDAYLLADGTADLLCYSDGYDEKIDALKDALSPLSDARAALRHDDVVGEATEKLNDAQAEFDDAEREAGETLSDAEAELSDARRKLDDGWAEYNDGKATLRRETADANVKIADGDSELADARLELEDAKTKLEDAVRELDDGEAEYADGLATWQEGKSDYEDGLNTWQDGWREYRESRQRLTDGQREYHDGLKQYEDGLVALQNGAGQLSAAKKQLDSAKRQLDSGSAALSAGREEYDASLKLYGDLKGGYDRLPADPQTLGLLLTASGPEAVLTGVVAPLAQMLDGLSQAVSGNVEALGAIQAAQSGLPSGAGDFSPDPTGAFAGILAARGTIGFLLPNAEQALEVAKGQLDSGSSSLASGYDQYTKGKKEYNDSKATFDQSVTELQDAKVKLDDARAELDDGWKKLADGKVELDDGWQELEDAALSLSGGEVSLREARTALEDGRRELAQGRADYEQGLLDYQAGVDELEQAKADLPVETAKAQKKLNDALAELQDGEAEYADGLKEYEDGKREADEKLSDARKKLNDARRKISEIEACKWYVLGRNTNMGYVSYQQDAERMGNLASVFPLIFFLVAALVCLTTMTRMVEEQRVQIGGMKALGYGKGAIALKYVGYGFLSSCLGGVVGLVAGCLAIPAVIFTAWGALYTIGGLVIPFYPGISLLSVGAAVLCVTGTAFAASFAALHAVPAALMRPRAPKPGKRVLLERVKPLWSHLSFTWKVTLRNLFRYKKRFWMTVIGIGGCAALIVTGFGIRDSILDTLNNQFDLISTYSGEVSLADDVTDDEQTEIARVLDGSPNVTGYLPCFNENLSAESPKRTMDAVLFAVEDSEGFDDFIHLQHRLDQSPVTLPDDGAVITEKLAELLGVGVGDTIILDGDVRVEVRVADTTENYIRHFVYVSAAYYETLYGAPPGSNVLLARYADESKEAGDAISASLIALSGVNSVSRIRDTRDTFSKSLETVDYAVVVVIISAAALAFVVLFNLTNINITERMRELATLKVLGFYDGELSSYVYRENVFLTLFGVALGLVMGKFLHQWLVLTVEIDMVMFGRAARPSSYLYAVGLTLLFSLLVNLAARRRLKKIDMVESLKTVE